MASISGYLCVLLLLASFTEPRPIGLDQTREREQRDALAYLTRFGYVGGPARNDNERLSTAIYRYQRFHGLKMTGQVDDATRAKMAEPRCGLPDTGTRINSPYSAEYASPRYITLEDYQIPNAKWENTTLRYFVHPPDGLGLSRKTLYYVAGLALQFWCIHTPLTMVPVFDNTSSREIDIKFARGRHNCEVFVVFDGPGVMLAHAIWPFEDAPGQGDVHVDADDPWHVAVIDTKNNLVQTLIHEFGHSLGILHSHDNSAIMFPHYKPGLLPRMTDDDLAGVQSLYGTPNATVDIRRRCSLGLSRSILTDIDAAMDGLHNEVYIFKGNQVYELYEEVQLFDDYLALELSGNISDHFPGAPENIDAAESFGGFVYLTKGYTVYKYNLSSARSYSRVAVTTLMAEFGYLRSHPYPNCIRKRFIVGIDRLQFIRDGWIKKVYPSGTVVGFLNGGRSYSGRSPNYMTASFSGYVYNDNGTLHPTNYDIYTNFYVRTKKGSTISTYKRTLWGIGQ